jgi:hypothetical protein
VRDAVAYTQAYLRFERHRLRALLVTKSYLIDAVWQSLFDRPFYLPDGASLIPRVTAQEVP